VVWALALLGAGGALLTAGAELFAEHVVGAARRVGLTTFGLALLLAGAEPEEALVSGLASARNRPDLAAGDVLGANVVIATLTLGLVALVTPIVLTAAVRRYAAVAAVAAGLAGAVTLGGVVQRWEGIALMAAYVLAVGVVWRRERRPPAVGEAGEVDLDADSSRDVLLVVFGLVGMVAGGVLAVLGAERLVTASGLGDGPVGLTLLALATSAEMLALVVAARRHGVHDVAVAGALGAVGYNATLSLGVGAVVAPLTLTATSSLFAAAVLVALVCAALFLWPARTLGRPAGALLVLAYGAGLAVVLT
jgi:cation:H+ antiporter